MLVEPIGKAIAQLLRHIIRIFAIRQQHTTHLERISHECRKILLGCSNTCSIAIVDKDYIGGDVVKKLALLFGESGTGTAHHIANTYLYHGEDIKLALDDIDTIRFSDGLASLV